MTCQREPGSKEQGDNRQLYCRHPNFGKMPKSVMRFLIAFRFFFSQKGVVSLEGVCVCWEWIRSGRVGEGVRVGVGVGVGVEEGWVWGVEGCRGA